MNLGYADLHIERPPSRPPRRSSRFKESLAWTPFWALWLGSTTFRDAFDRLTWSREQLEQFQLAHSQAIVRFAYERSPFYRDFYAQAGIHPVDIRRLTDLEGLPIVTKPRLRAAIADNTIFTRATPPIGTLARSTTGSSGTPLTLYYDLSARRHRYVNELRALWMMGALPHKRFALVWRKKELSRRQQLRAFLGLFKQVSVIDVMQPRRTALGKDEMRFLIDDLLAFQPQVLRVDTSSLWVIAQFIKKHALPLRPEQVISSAEYLSPAWKEEMEAIFQCPVHNAYGGTEAAPIAASLGGNNELTVFQDCYHTEVVDGMGRRTPPGHTGRVIVTDYHSRYMPLIRYEMGDVAEWSADEAGALPSFAEVRGRVNDVFVLPGRKLMFSHTWHIYFRHVTSIAKFKVVQHAVDRIEISLELAGSDGWNAELESVKQRVHQALGSDITIEWQIADSLDLDVGDKFRSVRSELDSQTILSAL